MYPNQKLATQWRERARLLRADLTEDTPDSVAAIYTDLARQLETCADELEAAWFRWQREPLSISVRWCSAYLKIDVARRVLCNEPSFKSGTFLLVTGERREESTSRSRYAELERHAASNKTRRRVDQWRAVIDWSERDVWQVIERWGIRPHPAYYLGWGRVSCRTCIFGSADQWATVREIAPATFETIAWLEDDFGKTIRRNASVRDLARQGSVFLPPSLNGERALASSRQYSIDVRSGNDWTLPAGAYNGDKCGPS